MEYLTDANVTVGRMARGFVLAYVAQDRAYYLLTPDSDKDPGMPAARVSELVVEQLVQEKMVTAPPDGDVRELEPVEFPLRRFDTLVAKKDE